VVLRSDVVEFPNFRTFSSKWDPGNRASILVLARRSVIIEFKSAVKSGDGFYAGMDDPRQGKHPENSLLGRGNPRI